ncbi:MAG: hypothetical protein HN623_13345 [Bdellovibrionales bacterium]|nr:hypothetical protein [Bdellovibrionales bacterium]
MKRGILIIVVMGMAIISTALLAKRSFDDGLYLAYNVKAEGSLPVDQSAATAAQPSVAKYQHQPFDYGVDVTHVDYETKKMLIDTKLKGERIRQQAQWEAKKARVLADLEIEKSRMEVHLFKRRVLLMAELEQQQYQKSVAKIRPAFVPKSALVQKREIASEDSADTGGQYQYPRNYQAKQGQNGYQWKATNQLNKKKEDTPYGFDFHPGGY